MYKVIAYTIYNNKYYFNVDTVEKAREYAKRITTEGLHLKNETTETFYPVHILVKVKIKLVE